MSLPSTSSSRTKRSFLPMIRWMLLAQAIVGLFSIPVLAQVENFDWETITPSDQLVWKDCYPEFQCTRLLVPLDYSDPDKEKAAIAIIRYPSKLASDDENYRGPLLFNPGGPGGSGVQFMLQVGASAQAITGPEFDILSFDPRGVGWTTPRLDIFSTRQESLQIEGHISDSMNSTADSLGRVLGVAQIASSLAQLRAQRVAAHMSTPEVARDMLNIVKAHNFDKIQYWGVSYGSVLGATFASMFPDNVGRIILDGVVDAENYYAALWSNNLPDSDAALTWFYEDCIDVGPEECAIYEPSVEQIRDRVNGVIERLRIAPIAFVNATDGEQGIVDYFIAKSQLFRTIYFPHFQGRSFANALAALEQGDSEPIWRLSQTARLAQLLDQSCDPLTNRSYIGVVSSVAIACGDGDPVQESLEDLRNFYQELSQQSSFADLWTLHVGCAGWKVQAKEKFQGNFVANTSHPILLIGNTADPVTPLRNAHKMATGFSGSVVLQQDNPGHTAFSANSVCSLGAARTYIRDGILPNPGTICPVESSSFGNSTFILQKRGSGSDGERAFLEAAETLQRGVYEFMKNWI